MRKRDFQLENLESRTLLAASLPGAGAVSLAYDGGGTLHVAWYDSAEGDLKYATCAPDGTLGTAVTVDAGPNVGSQLSLKVDSLGRVGIAYYDSGKGDLKFAEFDGDAWNVETVDTRGTVGQHPSLAFDASDHPLISYYAPRARTIRLAAFDG